MCCDLELCKISDRNAVYREISAYSKGSWIWTCFSASFICAVCRPGYQSQFFDNSTSTDTFVSIPVPERYIFQYQFEQKENDITHIKVQILSFIFQLNQKK